MRLATVLLMVIQLAEMDGELKDAIPEKRY